MPGPEPAVAVAMPGPEPARGGGDAWSGASPRTSTLSARASRLLTCEPISTVDCQAGSAAIFLLVYVVAAAEARGHYYVVETVPASTLTSARTDVLLRRSAAVPVTPGLTRHARHVPGLSTIISAGRGRRGGCCWACGPCMRWRAGSLWGHDGNTPPDELQGRDHRVVCGARSARATKH